MAAPKNQVKILHRVVQLESMPWCKHLPIDSGATPIGSAGRASDRNMKPKIQDARGGPDKLSSSEESLRPEENDYRLTTRRFGMKSDA